MKILRIYDNGGKTADRYTVYFNTVEQVREGKTFYMCLGMNAAPFHPQGIGQHSSGMLGRHNGKRIELKDLPLDCQKAVYQDLFPLKVRPLAKLKRKTSSWLRGFSNKVYPVNTYDNFKVNGEDINDIMLVAKTGPDDGIDYHLIYPDECKIIDN